MCCWLGRSLTASNSMSSTSTGAHPIICTPTHCCPRPLSHHEARPLVWKFLFFLVSPLAWHPYPETTNSVPRACLIYRPKYEVDTR